MAIDTDLLEEKEHGMNIGATSVGGMINNVKTFFASVLMPNVLHMRHTHLPEHKFISGQPDTEQKWRMT